MNEIGCENCIMQNSANKTDCIDCDFFWKKEKKFMIEACGTHVVDAQFDDLKLNKVLYLPVRVKEFSVTERGIKVGLNDIHGGDLVLTVSLSDLMSPLKRGENYD